MTRWRPGILVGMLVLLVTACTGASGSDTAPTVSPVVAQSFYVASGDGRGADFRRTPGPNGARIGALPDGLLVTTTGQEQQVDGQPWKEIRAPTGLTGWV